MNAGTGDHRKSLARPTLNSMNERGSQLLAAHIRSLDPAEPTVRERLEDAMGESLARKLVFAHALRVAS
jgi:hypothetical protein